MSMRRPLIVMILTVLAVLVLAACDVSLAADVTPPPDYQPPAQEQPVALETVFPLVPPDPGSGAVLYAEKCEPCHGPTGRGDGSQSANLPNPPPSIGTPELARQSRPVDWYNVITQGNLQKMMPGFSGSLDDRQRWDVTAYVYSLSLSADEIEQGRAIYTEECAACHGANGEGRGEGAPDWTQPARLAQLSAAEMSDVILKGRGNMPAYQGKLDESQVWAAAAFIRSMTFAAPAPSGEQQAQATPPAPPAADATPAVPGQVTISGEVINASGGTLPEGLKVRLLGFDQMQQSLDLEIAVEADGSFVFEQVETNPERVFMATAEVGGYTFNSDILHGADVAAGNTTMLILVYENSTDTSGLVADRMHVFFDFSKPGVMQVGELFIISNPTQKLIVPEEEGQPVLRFDLPEGATNLSFQDGAMGERYVQTEKGFGDTAAIQPGMSAHQVLFAYDLPYDRKINVSLTPPVPVTAAVIIAPAGNIKVQSSQLTDAGVKTMEDVQVHLYSANAIEAGSSLEVTLSGKPGGGTGFFDQNQLAGILVGVAALLVVVGLILLWYMRRRQADEDDDEGEEDAGAPESAEDLVDAIVALDDLYQSGELPKEAYDERRAALKERLRLARERDAQGS